MSQKCGYVAVLGAPNAGKSTLINQMVGSKVTIVSPKVQTTRNRVLGIALKGESQLVLIDTPGIFFDARRRLEKSMVNAAWSALGDSDCVVLVVDAHKRDQALTHEIFEKIHEKGKKIILILNKIDLVEKDRLLTLMKTFETEALEKVFMVSALSGNGVADVLTYLEDRVPEGMWLFPEDQLSDLPQRLLAAEITREQIFLTLHDELPYSTMVDTESWENFKNGSVKITQTIYVQRESQKAIVVGKGGRKIKAIGEVARGEMAEAFECIVHLNLRVKVRENWIDTPQHYKMWGLDYNVT